jgi:hypothetical protein
MQGFASLSWFSLSDTHFSDFFGHSVDPHTVLPEFRIRLVPQHDPTKSNSSPKRSVLECPRRKTRNRGRRVSMSYTIKVCVSYCRVRAAFCADRPVLVHLNQGTAPIPKSALIWSGGMALANLGKVPSPLPK